MFKNKPDPFVLAAIVVWLMLAFLAGFALGGEDSVLPSTPYPLHASVKITVATRSVQHHASGTIIDGTQGRSLVATCAHTWKGVAPDANVTVEHAGLSYQARVVERDVNNDVALLAIISWKPLPFAKLARIVPSIGDRARACGRDPNGRLVCRDESITAVDKYDAPLNLETSGRITEGMSGGGLFNSAGELLGILQGRRDDIRASIAVRLPALETLIQKTESQEEPIGLAAYMEEGTTDESRQLKSVQPPRIKVTVWMAPFPCVHCERMKRDCAFGSDTLCVTYRTGPPPWLEHYAGERMYPLYEWHTASGRWLASCGYCHLNALKTILTLNE